MRGNEREKIGTGKKLERTAFLSFPVPTNFDQRTSLAVTTNEITKLPQCNV